MRATHPKGLSLSQGVGSQAPGHRRTPVGGSFPHQEAAARLRPAVPLPGLTVHTAVCRMASKPPSGASRLPETRSPCSLFRNSFTSSVRLMTFLKEKGGSLLGQGSFSLGRGGGERALGRGGPCTPPRPGPGRQERQ